MSFQFKSELVTKVPLSEAGRFCTNPKFGAQEKYNGERRTIVKQGDQVISYNREGEISKPLDARVINVLRKHPLPQFIIDIELVGVKGSEQIYILDALILDEEMLASETYEYREARAHAEFDNYHRMITVVYTARTSEDKTALMLRLANEKAEGVVFRDMGACYKQGRSGQHFAIKFWKDADVIVMGPSPEGHNSVRVGVYDERGKLHEICGVSLNGKDPAKKGDVVAIKYLYATGDRHVVQPELLFVRTDKKAQECTIDQLIINKNWTK